MKTLLTILLAAGSLLPCPLMAKPVKDSTTTNILRIKYVLYCPDLFYGCELGEKPVLDKVDTLVANFNYDTTRQVDLVLVSATELGFTNQSKVRWIDILESALKKGYEMCPMQTGPELCVMSQNSPKGARLLALQSNVPVFIGAPEITKSEKHRFLFFNYYSKDGYVFCLKCAHKGKPYKLGYSTTNSADKTYFWSPTDKFIFSCSPKKKRF